MTSLSATSIPTSCGETLSGDERNHMPNYRELYILVIRLLGEKIRHQHLSSLIIKRMKGKISLATYNQKVDDIGTRYQKFESWLNETPRDESIMNGTITDSNLNWGFLCISNLNDAPLSPAKLAKMQKTIIDRLKLSGLRHQYDGPIRVHDSNLLPQWHAIMNHFKTHMNELDDETMKDMIKIADMLQTSSPDKQFIENFIRKNITKI